MNNSQFNCETPNKCRLVESSSPIITAVYYPPIYDSFGNNLNPDNNKFTTKYKCLTCNKEWVITNKPTNQS